MNKVILMGRLTRDPGCQILCWRKLHSGSPLYTGSLTADSAETAIPATADFIGCVAFGRQAEFAEKYLRQGNEDRHHRRIQTGSYTNREGQKVYRQT